MKGSADSGHNSIIYKRAYSGRAVEVFHSEAGHLAWSDQPELFGSMITEWVNTEHKS